jgi:hypothetical protein
MRRQDYQAHVSFLRAQAADDDDFAADEHQGLLANNPRRQRSTSSAAMAERRPGSTYLAILLAFMVGSLALSRPWSSSAKNIAERPGPRDRVSSLALPVPRNNDSPPPPPPSPPPPPPSLPPPTIELAPYANILNESQSWVRESVPHFECADGDITTAYWYRWRLFHLHMGKRPKRKAGCGRAGGCWVLTEFLQKVFWSGPHNTIVCPAGHHIMEGRWLRDETVLDDYARFWFRGDGWRKQYTWWAAHALHERSLLHHHSASEGVQAELFGDLDDHYHSWLRTHYSERGKCMFTSCHADGEENSAGLDGCRPTINSVMYGEAAALERIARALGNATRADYFAEQARRWQAVLTERLWDHELGFFMNEAQPPPPQLLAEIRRYQKQGRGREIQTYFGCLACHRGRKCPPERGWPVGQRVRVRELMGLSSPWYFRAVPETEPERAASYAKAFAQLNDTGGFGARWGPRTTERRSECYNFSNSAQCNWNGGSWPYETSKVATALINLLQTYPPQPTVGKRAFDRVLRTFAVAHTRTTAEGLLPPHVDEDLHPDDGYWITRRKLHGISPWPKTGGLGNKNGKDHLRGRGTHYFHSTFNDLVLSGLVGLRAHEADLEIFPLALVPWFCATRVRLRGSDYTILWDAYGTHYPHGAGMHVWRDGHPIGSAPPQITSEGTNAMPTPPRVRLPWNGGSLRSVEPT